MCVQRHWHGHRDVGESKEGEIAAFARSYRVAVLLVLLIGGCGPMLRPAVAEGAETFSVQTIYARLQTTLAASGKVYHVVVTEKDFGSAGRAPQKERVWVDAVHDVARQPVVYSATDIFSNFYLQHVTIQVLLHDPSQGG